jgi:hypothetical protein
LGLHTTEEPLDLLARLHELLGGSVEDDQLVDVPGLLVTVRAVDPAEKAPGVNEDEHVPATVVVTFSSFGGEEEDGRLRAGWQVFVASANLAVDLDRDALLTFNFDIACMRRRGQTLELFDHWKGRQEPWVLERLPPGYVLSEDLPRY